MYTNVDHFWNVKKYMCILTICLTMKQFGNTMWLLYGIKLNPQSSECRLKFLDFLRSDNSSIVTVSVEWNMMFLIINRPAWPDMFLLELEWRRVVAFIIDSYHRFLRWSLILIAGICKLDVLRQLFSYNLWARCAPLTKNWRWKMTVSIYSVVITFCLISCVCSDIVCITNSIAF